MKVRDFIKSSNIIKVDLHETLSSAISKLSSSHDAAFVFDGDKYMGVVNPYHCLIRSSTPANAKVEHSLFHAPHVKENFPISKVAQLMNESKVHYLPVFDDKENFIGIISARRVLAALLGSALFKISIGDIVKEKKKALVTVYPTDTVSFAMNELKKFRVSKLVMIGRDMKLKGIISYYDLISFLITPKEKAQKGERKGSKVSLNYQNIANFAKTFVLTLTAEDSMEEALHMILEKKIGSIVIVDKDRHPTAIITTKDFLNLIAKSNRPEILQVVSRDLSRQNRHIVSGFFNNISLWVRKFPDVSKARMMVKEEKGGGVFKVILSMFKKKGQPVVIKEEGKNLLHILQKIRKK